MYVLSLNPFKPNGISYSYQFGQSISVSAMSDLALHCLPISHKKGVRFVWFNCLHSGKLCIFLCVCV